MRGEPPGHHQAIGQHWLPEGRLLVPSAGRMVAVEPGDPLYDRWLPHVAPTICDGELCLRDGAPLQPEEEGVEMSTRPGPGVMA